MTGALMVSDATFSSCEDEEIIRLLNEIRATFDRDERKALYEELQVYMKENPPFIYLYEPIAFEAVNIRVQEYKPRSYEGYYLWDGTFVVGE